MEKVIRLALVQVNQTVGDLEGNIQKIIDRTAEAKKHGSDIVIFPELAVTGYPPEDLLFKRHFIDDNIAYLKKALKRMGRITAIIGFVDRQGNDIYNACAVIRNGKMIGIYRKKELPNYGVFDEARYFKHGVTVPLFILDDMPIGLSICEDIWVKKSPVYEQAKRGAKLIINISASPYHDSKLFERARHISRVAKSIKAYVAYANLVGGQDELIFDGASMVVTPDGKLASQGREFVEDIVYADIPVKELKSKDIERSSDDIVVNGFKLNPKAKLRKMSGVKKLERLEEIYEALVLGTRDYCLKNGFKKTVIGLSGGIDSALVALIACDALGKENVVGITMPSRYSSKGTRDDAYMTALGLGIEFKNIPIEEIYRTYLSTFSEYFAGLKSDTTEENLQARIRGNILMAFSNKFGWLVLTTGNKSETSCGYCTLYGDMAGGYAVIKDVPKTLVYKLAKLANKRHKAIPKTTFTRPPTAELKENQKDQDSLPPYDILDNIIAGYVERDKSCKEISFELSYGTQIVKDIVKKVDQNEYKRRQAPPGIKITEKAFGKDRRLPITNKYTEC